MNKQAVFHLPDSSYAHALSETRICIRLRTAKGDIKKCVLFYGNRVHPEPRVKMTSIDMVRVASDRLFDYYEADFETDINRICYYFWLTDGIEDYYYYSGVFTHTPAHNRVEYFQFPDVHRNDIAVVPKWAKNAILYQIFPDSFATGRKYISSQENMKITATKDKSHAKLGGTIRGITENIDYLADLGINCIYLNPIFTAESYHKYDTIDYFSIDPCFGTMDDFKKMVETCHKNGIRVILDGVFNHCGWRFFAFKDVCDKGEKSKYKDWFYQLSFPVDTEKLNYAAFAYVKQMPKLNTGNPDVIKYLCEVGRYWIREANIDGWRLDVANEVNHDFWRAFRKAVREEKPDAFLIGEIWEDAEQWLMGDQFDSAMNYRFTDICKAFFAGNDISVDDFDNSLGYMLMRYKKQITQVQMNMLDSHDVPRFLYYCNGDIRRLKLAALFLMTYVGIPSVFAGDEKAITGATEKEYRSPMVWEDNDVTRDLTEYYKKIISIRKKYISIFTGGVKTVLKDNAKGVYAFSRNDGDDEITVVLNNSENSQSISFNVGASGNDRTGYIDLLTEEPIRRSDFGEISLTLSPLSGAVIYRSHTELF